MKQKLIELINQPSTWRGIVHFLTGLGVVISTEQTDVIVSIGLSVSGFIGVLYED